MYNDVNCLPSEDWVPGQEDNRLEDNPPVISRHHAGQRSSRLVAQPHQRRRKSFSASSQGTVHGVRSQQVDLVASKQVAMKNSTAVTAFSSASGISATASHRSQKGFSRSRTQPNQPVEELDASLPVALTATESHEYRHHTREDEDEDSAAPLSSDIPRMPGIEPIGPVVRLPSAIKALQTELTVLKRELAEETCKVELIDSDIFNWEVAVTGPKGSPYHSGVFRFLFKFPADYPASLPRIRCATPIYHCNIDQNGTVCLGPFDQNGLSPQALLPSENNPHITESAMSTSSRRLHVTLIGARGLRNADALGYSDPYCTCHIPGKAWTKFQTAVIDNRLNPVWNEEHVINDFVPGDTLEFNVLDDDQGGDELLGRATLNSAWFYPEGYEGDVSLADKGHRATLRVKISVVIPRQQHDRATAVDIVEALLSLLTLPVLETPLVPAAARLFKTDRRQHDRIARDWTLRYAL